MSKRQSQRFLSMKALGNYLIIECKSDAGRVTELHVKHVELERLGIALEFAKANRTSLGHAWTHVMDGLEGPCSACGYIKKEN